VFRRLLKDKSGNTLVIFAASLVPLTMMVGSGLDVSITYMAQAKMQNACDAGVLAGRQSMQGNAWNLAAKAEAEKFFDFNFPDGTHGVQNAVFTVDQDQTDRAQIVGEASGTVPTSLMYIFGYDELPISAECDAKRDLGHNDVMLVLDTTGSMAWAPSTGGASKISRLRNGARGLYRALRDDENGSITRYGMVSYSQTVNVARSLANRDILTNQEYVDWVRVCGYYSCWWDRRTKTVHVEDSSWGDPSDSTNQNKRSFRTSGSGCIEERPSIGNSDNPFEIEATITRADIDERASNGSDKLRQFGRYDPAVQEGESQSGCPGESRKLRTYSGETGFNNAINSVTSNVTGGTYHDIGMLWGTRFISRTGFFASENPTERDGIPVNQHIVFMTDGRLETYGRLYSAHGIEDYQNRTQGSGSLSARHIARFNAACDVAKSMGITIWVIALDVTDIDDVKPCATSEGHFYTSDGDDLEQVFEQIGQGIGNLRLTR
jgi:hypothetical protein